MHVENEYTAESLGKAIRAYLDAGKRDDGFFCPKCGARIRQGFLNVFYPEDTEPNPVRVPYCERCDPPDGFNYTYARRVFIRP